MRDDIDEFFTDLIKYFELRKSFYEKNRYLARSGLASNKRDKVLPPVDTLQ